MRAPFAPHMSFGSRATRRILKREHPIPSYELKPHFFAGNRRCAVSRVDFRGGDLFLMRGNRRRTVARHGAETEDRAGEQEYFGNQREV
jgi:hypothetical protein